MVDNHNRLNSVEFNAIMKNIPLDTPSGNDHHSNSNLNTNPNVNVNVNTNINNNNNNNNNNSHNNYKQLKNDDMYKLLMTNNSMDLKNWSKDNVDYIQSEWLKTEQERIRLERLLNNE